MSYDTKLDKCLKDVEKITNSVSTKLENAKGDKEIDKIKTAGIEDVHKSLKENTEVSDDTLVALASYFAYSNALDKGGGGSDESITSSIDGVLTMLGFGDFAKINDAATLLKTVKGIPSKLAGIGSAAMKILPYAAVVAAVAAAAGLIIDQGNAAGEAANKKNEVVETPPTTPKGAAGKVVNFNAHPTGNIAVTDTGTGTKSGDVTVADAEDGDLGKGEPGYKDSHLTVAGLKNSGNYIPFASELQVFADTYLNDSHYNHNISNNDYYMENRVGMTRSELTSFNEEYTNIENSIEKYSDEEVEKIMGLTSNERGITDFSTYPTFDFTDPIKSIYDFLYTYYSKFYMKITKRNPNQFNGTTESVRDNFTNTYKSLLNDLLYPIGLTEFTMTYGSSQSATLSSTGAIEQFKKKYNNEIDTYFSRRSDKSSLYFPDTGSNSVYDDKSNCLRAKCYVQGITPPGVEDEDLKTKSYKWWFNKTLCDKNPIYDKLNKVAYARFLSGRDNDQSIPSYLGYSATLINSFDTTKSVLDESIENNGFYNTVVASYMPILEDVYTDSGFVGFKDANELIENLGTFGYVTEDGRINFDKLESDLNSNSLPQILDQNGNILDSSEIKKLIATYKNSPQLTAVNSVIETGQLEGDSDLILYGQSGYTKSKELSTSDTDVDVVPTGQVPEESPEEPSEQKPEIPSEESSKQVPEESPKESSEDPLRAQILEYLENSDGSKGNDEPVNLDPNSFVDVNIPIINPAGLISETDDRALNDTINAIMSDESMTDEEKSKEIEAIYQVQEQMQKQMEEDVTKKIDEMQADVKLLLEDAMGKNDMLMELGNKPTNASPTQVEASSPSMIGNSPNL